MMPLRLALSFVSFVLLPGLAPAQEAVLRGRVTDAETGDALVGAHVFVAGSTAGTTTDAEGDYRLPVPAGAHRLYVSMIGFADTGEEVVVREAEEATYDFALAPRIVELAGVTVEAEQDRKWRKRLRKFERLFLGETPNAEQTTLLNPEVLDFEGGWGRLAATASAPLVLENRALGYRITYFLEAFEAAGGVIRYDGEPLFEAMEPADEAQAAAGAEARARTYRGSLRHFLQALLAGRARDEGFLTFTRWDLDRRHGPFGRFPVRAGRLLEPGVEDDLPRLDFHRFLEVEYTGEAEGDAYKRWIGRGVSSGVRNQISWLELNDGPAAIDGTGEPVDPYAITSYGHFAFERVADEVPKEYAPPERAGG